MVHIKKKKKELKEADCIMGYSFIHLISTDSNEFFLTAE